MTMNKNPPSCLYLPCSQPVMETENGERCYTSTGLTPDSDTSQRVDNQLIQCRLFRFTKDDAAEMTLPCDTCRGVALPFISTAGPPADRLDGRIHLPSPGNVGLQRILTRRSREVSTEEKKPPHSCMAKKDDNGNGKIMHSMPCPVWGNRLPGLKRSFTQLEATACPA